jgi:hypothetical protein
VPEVRDSCREFFEEIKNIFFCSIPSLLLLVVNNKVHYKVNSQIYSINTRQNSNLYQLLSNITTFQSRTNCFGIKVFNNLPSHTKILSHNVKHFK